MPRPVSSTATRTLAPSSATRIVIDDPSGQYLDRVLDQVGQHLLDGAVVGQRRGRAGRDGGAHRELLDVDALAKGADDLVRDRTDVDRVVRG